MKLICKPRRAGKTTEAIIRAAESGAYLIVKNRAEAQRISKQAEEMNLKIRFPVTFDELLKGQMQGSFVRNVVIDNADMLLQAICPGLEIEAITLNSGEDNIS